MEECSKELERRLAELVRQKQEQDRWLLRLEWVVGTLSVLVILIPAILAAYLPVEQEWHRAVLVFSGFVPGLIGVYFALRIEQIAGYYACKSCGHRHVPTYKAVFFAPHMGRTRYLRCPECGQKGWQKKVIYKEES